MTLRQDLTFRMLRAGDTFVRRNEDDIRTLANELEHLRGRVTALEKENVVVCEPVPTKPTDILEVAKELTRAEGERLKPYNLDESPEEQSGESVEDVIDEAFLAKKRANTTRVELPSSESQPLSGVERRRKEQRMHALELEQTNREGEIAELRRELAR